MNPESLSGFSWLFESWNQIVTSLILLTAPIFTAISTAASGLILSVGFYWLMVTLFRWGVGGSLQGFGGNIVVFLVMAWGLQPDVINTSANSTVVVPNISALGYNVALSLQSQFSSVLDSVSSKMDVDGGIMPAAAVTQAAVDRAADQFANTDLARLIRDYNAQCGPRGSIIRDGQASLDAYHAVGLAGGAGLGVPDDEITVTAQMMMLYKGTVDFVSGSTGMFTGNAIEKTFDAELMRWRRADGVAMLEAEGRGFKASNGAPYLLPKTEYWSSVYRGEPTAQNAYLSLSDSPVELGAVAWSETTGKDASQGFSPGNCVEAYKVAQFAAEQAYQALIETGGLASSGQRASTDSGRLGAALAWQRAINRTMNEGTLNSGAIGQAVGGVVAVTQAVKNEVAWYEMYTLMPAFIGGMGALLWLLLVTAPVFILIAPVFGPATLTTWASGVIFCPLAIVFSQLITVCIALAMTGAAVFQAAVASGWNGGGGDLDIILGLLPMAGPFIIGGSIFLAGIITGFSVQMLSGIARSAVATTTDAAKAVAAVARLALGARGFMQRESSHAASTAERAARAERQNGGGGGGGGRNGGAAAPSQSHLTGSGSSGSVDSSGAGLARKAANFEQMKRRLNARAEATSQGLVPKKGEE